MYASANISVDSQTSQSTAWAFAHLLTLVKLRTCDWLSLKPLGNNRPQRKSKNIFRGITMGIGPIWGINSLSPFILSWFDFMMFSPLGEGGGGYSTNIYTGRLCHEVQPLTFLYTIFHEKGTPFIHLLLTNGTPFTYLQCLQFCIPFNCCKIKTLSFK